MSYSLRFTVGKNRMRANLLMIEGFMLKDMRIKLVRCGD